MRFGLHLDARIFRDFRFRYLYFTNSLRYFTCVTFTSCKFSHKFSKVAASFSLHCRRAHRPVRSGNTDYNHHNRLFLALAQPLEHPDYNVRTHSRRRSRVDYFHSALHFRVWVMRAFHQNKLFIKRECIKKCRMC